MRIFFAIILLISGIAISCGKNNHAPRDLIQEKEMVKVLWDMSLAEDFASVFIMKDSSKVKDLEIQKQYEKVFALHHINRDQFTRSYKYYRSDPDAYKRLMDSTNAYAQSRKQDLYRNDIIKF